MREEWERAWELFWRERDQRWKNRSEVESMLWDFASGGDNQRSLLNSLLEKKPSWLPNSYQDSIWALQRGTNAWLSNWERSLEWWWWMNAAEQRRGTWPGGTRQNPLWASVGEPDGRPQTRNPGVVNRPPTRSGDGWLGLGSTTPPNYEDVPPE